MKIIKNFLRLGWSLASLIINMLYDLYRYYWGSASNARRMTDNQLKARLFQKAHSIEKGLALPSVRTGFGSAPLKELKQLLTMYEQRGLSKDDMAYVSAKQVITAYINFHKAQGQPILEELNFVYDFYVENHDAQIGGVVLLKREDVIKDVQQNFEKLVNARHSTRMFASSQPDMQLVKKAVAMASMSPSVCNRQGGRVSIISNKELLKEVLHVQGGNRGFTDEIPMVLVVTCYIGLFRGARERNQCWIDGGLFAMTLLYALSYLGFGTCPLNWSADYKQDMKLRKILDIPDDQAVIMLIAVGDLREEYRVASSARIQEDAVTLRVYS